MPKKLVMRLIIDKQEVLVMEGTKKGRKVDWEGIKEGSGYYPPFLMKNKNVGETYEALTKYLNGLVKNYTIAIDHKEEE